MAAIRGTGGTVKLKKVTPNSGPPKPSTTPKPPATAGPGGIANALQAELQKRAEATRGKESGKPYTHMFLEVLYC